MTKWEIGQDLIAISDFIGEKEAELRSNKDNARLANQLRLIRLQVGELFNDNNDHQFRLPDAGDVT